jgi:hypothetical protein
MRILILLSRINQPLNARKTDANAVAVLCKIKARNDDDDDDDDDEDVMMMITNESRLEFIGMWD